MYQKRHIRAIMTIVFLTILIAIQMKTVSGQQGGFMENFDDPSLPGWEHSPGVEVAEGVLRIEPGNFVVRPGEWGEPLEISAVVRWNGEGEFVFTYQTSGGSSYILVVGPNYLVSQT